MHAKSRQVFKKRNGDNITIDRTKRRRFKSVLFFDSELMKLDEILETNDINLEGE